MNIENAKKLKLPDKKKIIENLQKSRESRLKLKNLIQNFPDNTADITSDISIQSVPVSDINQSSTKIQMQDVLPTLEAPIEPTTSNSIISKFLHSLCPCFKPSFFSFSPCN